MSNVNTEAVELAIMMIEEQKYVISSLQTRLDMMNTNYIAMAKKVNTLTNQVKQLNNVIADIPNIKNDINEIKLDTGAEHQVNYHNQDIVETWKDMLSRGADINEYGFSSREISHRADEMNNRRASSNMHTVRRW